MHSHRINLTDPSSTTPPLSIPPGAAKLSIDINDGSSYTWGSAVVDMQFSLSMELDEDGTDLTNWQDFPTAVQFTSSVKARRAISVTGYGWVRLKVSTSASAADIGAVVTIVRNWNA